MKLIDTHAHVYLPEFEDDRDQMMDRCLEAGVNKIFMPNIDSSTIEAMLAMEDKYRGVCIPMMGLHPGSVKEDFEKELERIEYWLRQRPFSAVGEIGLDFYWDIQFKEQQFEALKIQIGWALELDLPIVLHTRDSFEETFEVVSQPQNKGLRGVFHCFGGDTQQASRIAEIGFYLGIGGISTFKNGGLNEVIPHLAESSLLLETDSPYLAPVPYRGKRNEPSYLNNIAQRVAELKQSSPDKVAQVTTQNALDLFSDNGI